MAKGFSSLAGQTTVLVRFPRNPGFSAGDLMRRFDLPSTVKIRFYFGLPRLATSGILRPRSVAAFLLHSRPDLVYARDLIVPFFSSRLGIPTAVETHAYPSDKSPLLMALCSEFSGNEQLKTLVTIAPSLSKNFRELGVPASKLLEIPTAAEVAFPTVASAPLPLERRSTKKSVTYAGSLSFEKGIQTLLDLAKLRPDCVFRLFGGTRRQQAVWQLRARLARVSNFFCVGWVEPAEVLGHLRNSDVLIIPSTSRHEASSFTSPVKLGEYAQAQRPMVLSKIPAMARFLGADGVFWAEPDNVEAFSAALNQALTYKRSPAIQDFSIPDYKQRAREVIAHSLTPSQPA